LVRCERAGATRRLPADPIGARALATRNEQDRGIRVERLDLGV
jgi:hypothetical protein